MNMTEIPVDFLAAFFRALSDPTRLRIVNLLIDGKELCVCDIERVLALPQARVSQHLSVLRSAGLVAARRCGIWMHYSLPADAPHAAALPALLRGERARVPELQRDMAALRTSGCCAPGRNARGRMAE
jgi:ArsR family transcriptional regulator